MRNQNNKSTECCTLIDPALWEDKTFVWQNRKFIRTKVCTFFFMPLNFGGVMRKIDMKIREAGAVITENVCLSDHTSKWNMDVLISVDREIPGAENLILSGNFFSKVYEGPFSDTGKWCKDFEAAAGAREMKIIKWYMWYIACPKCAKKFGKNYVVIIGQTG